MKTATALWSLIAITITCHSAEYDLGPRGKISIEPPTGWTVKATPRKSPTTGATEYFIDAQAPAGTRARCTAEIFYYSKPMEKDAVQKRVKTLSEGVKRNRPTAEVGPIQDFSFRHGYGGYIVAKIAAPDPVRDGGYKANGFGFAELGHGVVTTIRLFADDPESQEFKSAVAAINSLEVKRE